MVWHHANMIYNLQLRSITFDPSLCSPSVNTELHTQVMVINTGFEEDFCPLVDGPCDNPA